MKFKSFSPLGVKIAISIHEKVNLHKAFFPAVPNTIGFAKETNLPFILWSRSPFLKDQ